MMLLRSLAGPMLLLMACSTARPALQSDSTPAPLYAAHQHLISAAFAKIINQPELNGDSLLRLLDDAGIRRGIALSMGYSFGDERKKVADPDRATADEVMEVFASAIERGDPRARNLYFDQTAVATSTSAAEEVARIARMIRRVGPARVLFGSDMPVSGNPPPAESWAIFRAKVPLTAAEMRTIALNEPPYARGR